MLNRSRSVVFPFRVMFRKSACTGVSSWTRQKLRRLVVRAVPAAGIGPAVKMAEMPPCVPAHWAWLQDVSVPEALFQARAWHLSVAPAATMAEDAFTGKMKPAEGLVRNVVRAIGARAESGASDGAAHSSIVNPVPASNVPVYVCAPAGMPDAELPVFAQAHASTPKTGARWTAPDMFSN